MNDRPLTTAQERALRALPLLDTEMTSELSRVLNDLEEMGLATWRFEHPATSAACRWQFTESGRRWLAEHGHG